ncbi:hypothetical protein [Natronococcus sp.]|uniref:hypothetical protein n=1 Tax=Natronococcus sp. TaxID=35747 RepID=UPI003A4E4327
MADTIVPAGVSAGARAGSMIVRRATIREVSARVLEEDGDSDNFTETTVAVPDPSPEEIRVEVAATSLNPVESCRQLGVT